MPQGSILGPLLFVLYINQLPTVLSLDCFLYTDDTAIVCTGSTSNEIVTKMTMELHQAAEWLSDHRLTLNLNKTKAMFFGTAPKLSNVSIDHMEFESVQLDIVDKFEYLGMMLDCQLRCDKHVTYLQSKVCPKMKTLARIRCYIGKKTALHLYNTLINPLFVFNDYIYDALSSCDSAKLQVMQNNCIRICLKAHRQTPHSELFSRSGIKPLVVQRKGNTSGMVYLGLNQLSTPFVNTLFSKVENIGGWVLRSEIKGEVIVPNTKLNIARGNIRYRGPVNYNIVGTEIRNAKTFKTFKRRLKKVTPLHGNHEPVFN